LVPDELARNRKGPILSETDSVSAWFGPTTMHGGQQYADAIDVLRRFLAAFAGSRISAEDLGELRADLLPWIDRLEAAAVPELEQVYARRADLPGRGQVTWPTIDITHADDDTLEGNVRFSRFYLGRNGVVHGGATLLLFDELAGRTANMGDRPIARTAYVKADFRAPVLIDTDLRISARIVREEGRKRFVRLELHHGDVLCTEGEVLMVELRPGQI
jgi:acyl-coenzyme A thioesterase PaaI-like protein